RADPGRDRLARPAGRAARARGGGGARARAGLARGRAERAGVGGVLALPPGRDPRRAPAPAPHDRPGGAGAGRYPGRVMSPASEPAAAAVPRRPDAERAGALPNLIVIGAQKCGTSGLHYHLSLHPQVSMSKPKELNFFIAERNWPRGEAWYRRQFDPRAKVRGESSPNYTAYPQHTGVPERMHSLVPDAKLIYIV